MPASTSQPASAHSTKPEDKGAKAALKHSDTHSHFANNDLEQQQILQRLKLIGLLALLLVGSSSSSAVLGLGLLLFTDIKNVGIWGIIITALVGVSSNLISFFIARSRRNPSTQQADRATYFLLGGLVLTISAAVILLSSGSSMPAAFIILPVLTGICGLSRGKVIFTSVGSAVLLAALYITEKIMHLYQPVFDATQFPWLVLFDWLLMLGIIAGGVASFAATLFTSNQKLIRQTQTLTQLLNTLNTTQQYGFDLSRELSSATNELNATSKQQASGAQEQVAAVTQVTSSLEELSETANQIAASSQAATSAANQTVEIAARVSDSSETSQTKAEEGRKAVEQTVQSVIQLRNRIELLGQRLLNLTEQNRRVSSIIDLIDEIADETHLLALNASIEAAGTVGGSEATAGLMDTGTRQLRSERFGVIAQEIKNLSDRSREATEEVRQAITEMQGAVAAAVLVAEEGKKSTVDALQRAEIAGFVIDSLNEVIDSTAHDFDQVLKATEVVKQRCEEISIATNQQRTANVQIVQTMRNIASVAQQTASSVSQISLAVAGLNGRVEELNNVLATADHVIANKNHNDKGDSGSNSVQPLPFSLNTVGA